MRLFEIEDRDLFLHSRQVYEPGVRVTPHRSSRRSSSVMETALERGRPDACCSRGESIYLQHEPNHTLGRCYRVKSVGGLERNHTGWVKMIQRYEPAADDPRLIEWVSGYWSGAECLALEGSWELRTRQLTILEVIEPVEGVN